MGSEGDGPLLVLDAGGDDDESVSELPTILTRRVRGCADERNERNEERRGALVWGEKGTSH